MLYKVAFATGLRCGELASLTTASLLLEDGAPSIVVEAVNSKRGQLDGQLIPTWLAADLLSFLRSRPVAPVVSRKPQPLFRGSWHSRAAEMIRADLKAAEIDYADDAGHVFDFHGQRKVYTTGHSKRGVHRKRRRSSPGTVRSISR